MITLAAPIDREKYKLHSDTGMIWLLDVDRDGTNNYRLTNWTEAVTYNTVTYSPFAMLISDVSENPGMLTEIQVTVSNVLGVAQGFLEDDEILNRRATLRVITVDQDGDTTGAMSATYIVISATATKKSVTIVLGTAPLTQVIVPRDRFIRTRCRWVFKSTECTYDGVLTQCNKAFVSADGCSGRDNQINHGGFPYLLTGREAMGLLGE